jgi:serine/threonine protein kinase/TolB-like protein/Flp pilus assembly protein TadD
MIIAPGTTIGRYIVISFLGKGGMGEVYKALDSKLKRPVALKILPAPLVSDEERVMRFEREARAASALNHPHILTIYEIGEALLAGGAQPGLEEGAEMSTEAATIHYIAMEYIQGETLRVKFRQKEVDLKKRLDYLKQVADGLAKAHAAGIVHRDLKPDNIMVTQDGYAKILDFGLAKLVEQEAPESGADESPSEAATARMEPNSRPGMIIGTLGYMSPEQAQGLPVDQRSDVFSFGCILYEATASHKPFNDASTIKLLHSLVYEEPPPITNFSPQAPADLQRIIRRCLVKDPEQRYQSIKDVAIELGELQQELGSGLASKNISQGPPLGDAFTDGRGQPTTSTSPGLNSQTAGGGDATNLSLKVPLLGAARRHMLLPLAGLAVLAVTLAAFAYFYFARGEPVIDSIAVLPFTNVGADPDAEYLSDGLTESIINNLSQLKGLAVIARSSVFKYRGKEVDPKKVGEELAVRAVMIGRIVQRADLLTISVELVDAQNNHQIWGEQYNCRLSEILSAQAEISREISARLRLRLTGEEEKRLTKRYTENVDAYQSYLKGRYYWNKRTEEDIKRSIQYFQEAIVRDPNYAMAYAGLADCYIVLPVYSRGPFQGSQTSAKEAALRALELDDTLAEAHTSLGAIRIDHEWDFRGGEVALRRAIELNPNYATAHHWYSQFLSEMGRHDEAIAEIRRAQSLDPLSLIINSVLGDAYIKARRYDEAVTQLRKTLEMDKNFSLAHRLLGNAYIAMGRFEEAISEYQQAEVLSGGEPDNASKKASALRAAFAKGGSNGYWQKQLELLNEQMKVTHVFPYQLASAYAHLGDNEQSIQWLRKALDEHDSYVLYLKIDPEFDGLRADPRVIEIMRRIGLPQ